MVKMITIKTAFQFPTQIIGLWAGVTLFRALINIGILIYIIKYFDVERHFFIVLLADNIICLLMSLGGFINQVSMLTGFYNLTTCYLNFFCLYNILLIGAVVTALISVLR